MLLKILISTAMAANLLVKAPSANPHEFFVHAQNSGDTKISSHMLTCGQADRLLDLFKQAQFHFLNSSLEAAREKFTAVTEFKWGCDWQEEERKILVFSFLRLAQMSAEGDEQNRHLTSAIHFDDTIPPDVSVFPPPLVASYKKIKGLQQKVRQTLPAFVKSYSYLLRNGRFQSLSDFTFESYNVKARLTFVSDAYRAETFVVNPEDLGALSVEPLPLVQGTCGDFKISDELQGVPNLKIFFNANCINEGAPSQLNTALHGQTLPASMKDFPDLPDTRKKSWIERNYLWVGAAVVGSLLIAHKMAQKEDGPQAVYVPSHTLSQ